MCIACAEIVAVLSADHSISAIDVNCADHADYAEPDSVATDSIDTKIIASTEVNSTSSMLPSIVQPPKLELKQLSNHLKYVFLAEDEQLPVIIAKNIHAN